MPGNDLSLADRFESHLAPQLKVPALATDIANSLCASDFKGIDYDGSRYNTKVDDVGLAAIVESLRECKIDVRSLSLRNNFITTAGFEGFIGRLVTERKLKYLDLKGNDIEGQGIRALHLASAENELEYLDLSFNTGLGSEGGMKLAESLTTNTRLKHLLINSCGLDLSTLIHIISSLEGNYAIETLEIDRPLIQSKEDEESDHLSRIIEKTSTLRKLSLRYSGITDFGAKLMADTLCTNRSLMCLNLECNRIGTAGAEALATYLIYTTGQGLGYGLETLLLSYNVVGNAGCVALAQALETNTSLKHLSLKSNTIDVALEQLGYALEKNNTLQTLSLFGNDFNQVSGPVFFDLIRNRLRYTGMKLDIEVYVVDGEYMIAEVK
jgi:Ran GTPase-activating protein (RanGAP) involved in mRNA processing and transport